MSALSQTTPGGVPLALPCERGAVMRYEPERPSWVTPALQLPPSWVHKDRDELHVDSPYIAIFKFPDGSSREIDLCSMHGPPLAARDARELTKDADAERAAAITKAMRNKNVEIKVEIGQRPWGELAKDRRRERDPGDRITGLGPGQRV